MTTSLMVPPGHRFVPTDEELVGYYLYNKITGIAFPEGVIPECDLYGPHNPWDIWHRHRDQVVKTVAGEDLYFFTRLKRKTPGAKRVERRVGMGSWEGEAAPKKIYMMLLGTRQCIGSMKRFRFEKSQTHQDGAWIMHEYSLDYDSLLPPTFQLQTEEYVICRIRKNKRMMVDQNKRKGYEENDEFEYHPQKLLKHSAPDEHQIGNETEKEMLSMQTNYIDSENLDSVLASTSINIEASLKELQDIFYPDHQTQFDTENRDDNISYWKKVDDTFNLDD